MSGTPITDTDAKDFPAGAYVDDTVDGKQQLLMSPSPSPLRYRMGAGSGGGPSMAKYAHVVPTGAPVADGFDASASPRSASASGPADATITARFATTASPPRARRRARLFRSAARRPTAVAFTLNAPRGEASLELRAHLAYALRREAVLSHGEHAHDEVEEPRRGGEFRVEEDAGHERSEESVGSHGLREPGGVEAPADGGLGGGENIVGVADEGLQADDADEDLIEDGADGIDGG